MDTHIPFNKGAINATDCISRGWDMIKDKYWLFLGITLLGMVIGGCVPCLSLFMAGPIMVGIYYCMFTRIRGGEVQFEMLFKGFDKFVPAMVIGLIEALPAIIFQIFRLTIDLSTMGMRGRGGRTFDFFASSSSRDFPAMEAGLMILLLVVSIFFFFFSIAWAITFRFALPLLTEHNLDIMETIKLSARAGWSNVGGLIVLFILQVLVALLGMLALCVGILFVIPVIHASNALAYRMVFPEGLQNNVYNEPPRPDYYGGTFASGQ